MKKIFLFELRKDLVLIFLLVFSFCFTSFSIPLLVGGVSGQTLEVFIAEKLKDPSTWPEAMALFFLEIGFIFLFFSLLYGRPEKNIQLEDQKEILYLIPSLPFLLLPILPSLLIFVGLGGVFFTQGVWSELFLIREFIFKAWIWTLCTGLGTGVFVLLLLSGLAFCLRDLFLRRFLLAWGGSSAALMGFSFLLIGSDGVLAVWLKWSLGLSLLFLPALYRLMGESVLRRLTNQINLADLMGAGKTMSFVRIIWPQCAGVFFLLAGVAAFWACGDFAYSSIVAGGESHLALLIQDLFASYRFDLAVALTWLLILSAILCFALFAGLAFVFEKNKNLQGR